MALRYARDPSNVPAARVKTFFVINLHSGRSRSLAQRAQEFARQHGHDHAVTERRRHAAELAADARDRGYELVVAVGGDGTMNEVAGALVGSATVLGLVPAGSGNGLARDLGIHGTARHIFSTLQDGRVRAIDAALADGHPFFTVAGLGFEATISELFGGRGSRGFSGYIATAARQLLVYPPQHYRICADGYIHELDAFTVAVANSTQYGNRARIAPRARLDDGLLDLVAVPAVSWRNGAGLLARLFHGSILEAKGLYHIQSSHVVIQREAPGLIHTDGEIHPAGVEVEFSVQRGGLRVLVPPTL